MIAYCCYAPYLLIMKTVEKNRGKEQNGYRPCRETTKDARVTTRVTTTKQAVQVAGGYSYHAWP